MRPYLLGVAVVAVIALAIAGAWYLPANAGAREEVTIGMVPQTQTMLLYVAEEQGYFSDNNLNVTIVDSPSGAASIQALARGRGDLTVSGEYPVVGAALGGEQVRVIGSIDRSQTHFLVMRNETGIATVSDLAGKRVGVARGSQNEFFLGRFLERNGMHLADITIVDVLLSESEEHLVNGSVDACIVRVTELGRIRERFGGSVTVWSVNENQPGYTVLAGRTDWIAAHPATVERVLRALARAEDFAVENPDGAKAVVGRRLNLADAYVDEIWQQNQFGLSLDRSLLTAMTDEARWMVRANLTSATAVPDFTEYIDPAPLAAVDPAAVNIVGAAGTGSPAGTEARR